MVEMAESTMRVFQSTPPARGATREVASALDKMERFQSTPPARGATAVQVSGMHPVQFQSTPPARGATWHPAGPGAA